MNLNSKAIKSIKSNYIKEYLTSINHEFNTREQITLIYNSEYTIDEKTELLIACMSSEDCSDDIIEDVKLILRNNKKVKSLLNGEDDNYMIVFNDELNGWSCIKNLDLLKNNIEFTEKHIIVNICNITNGTIVLSVLLNDKLEVIKYITHNNYLDASELESAYVNIPNSLQVGDIVTKFDEEDGIEEEFVVLSCTNVPNQLMSGCNYYSDMNINVISKELLDGVINNKEETDYKSVVENIIKDRINNIDNVDYDDVIAALESNVHITHIEKLG